MEHDSSSENGSSSGESDESIESKSSTLKPYKLWNIMASTKYDVEKFTGSNDFSLWQVKMQALLVQQGISEAINGEENLPKTMTEDNKKLVLSKAYSALILSLGDKPLREVQKEKTAKQIWDQLEKLYMAISLHNRLYLKQKLYSFKMTEDKSLLEKIDDFNKIMDDLLNIEVNLEEEDKGILLLNSIPKSYKSVKDAIIFGRTTVTYDEVITKLKTKELQRTQENQGSFNGEGLNVRGRSEKKDQNQNRGKTRSKSKKGARSKSKGL